MIVDNSSIPLGKKYRIVRLSEGRYVIEVKGIFWSKMKKLSGAPYVFQSETEAIKFLPKIVYISIYGYRVVEYANSFYVQRPRKIFKGWYTVNFYDPDELDFYRREFNTRDDAISRAKQDYAINAIVRQGIINETQNSI